MTGLGTVVLVTPSAADAQQPGKQHRIGLLTPNMRSPTPMYAEQAFLEGLREHGYVEDQNVRIERRFADNRLERLPALAAELVRSGVDVIVVAGPGPVRAAKEATTTTPIVMLAGSSDPVAEGLAASLGRPGGNITGLTYAVSSERFAKQLELLKSAAARTSRVAVLWDLPLQVFRQSWAPALEEAGRKLTVAVLDPVQVRDREDLGRAFATIRGINADAVLVVSGGVIGTQLGQIANLAVQHRLPTMAAFRQFPQAGGLMSYGPDITELYRRGASFVDRILKGAKPAELPIEQPTKFELVINLRTVRALGLTIPPALLARADEVIQ